MTTLDETFAAMIRTAVREAIAEAPQQPGALTLAAAAKYCATSEPTIRRLILSGELPSLRVGREYRVGRKVLDEMLARGASVESSAR